MFDIIITLMVMAGQPEEIPLPDSPETASYVQCLNQKTRRFIPLDESANAIINAGFELCSKHLPLVDTDPNENSPLSLKDRQRIHDARIQLLKQHMRRYLLNLIFETRLRSP